MVEEKLVSLSSGIARVGKATLNSCFPFSTKLCCALRSDGARDDQGPPQPGLEGPPIPNVPITRASGRIRMQSRAPVPSPAPVDTVSMFAKLLFMIMESGGLGCELVGQPHQVRALGNHSRPGRDLHVIEGFKRQWRSWRRLLWLWIAMVLTSGTQTAPGVQCQSDGSFTFRPGAVEGYKCSVDCAWQGCLANPGCRVVNSALQLIPDDNGTNTFVSARFMRAQPARLWGTSFWTFFVIRVSQIANDTVGDGFTFLIAPNTSIPMASWGGGLGLFENGSRGATDESFDGKDSRIVGIVFDSFSNNGDPGTPYIGLHINSIRPTKIWRFLGSNNSLGVDFLGNTFGVWVEYNVGSQQVEVSMLSVKQPFFPAAATRDLRPNATTLFSTSLNVTDSVAELSYVGFSAATGKGVETNEIFYWQFQMGELESSALSVPAGPAPGPFSAAVPAPTPRPGVEPAAGPAPPPTPGVEPDDGHMAGMSVAAIVTVSSTVVLIVLIASGVLLFCCCRERFGLWAGLRKRAGGKLKISMANLTSLRAIANTSVRKFSYDELRLATLNFAETSVLGEGGFGKVFRGQLKDGTAVAVKRISERSRQGAKEFLPEVTIIGRLRHQSLVPLLGWCLNTSKGELLLVYEYMPNGSLDHHVLRQDLSLPANLHSSTSTSGSSAAAPPQQESGVMSWDARCHVLQGVASALLCLHEDWQEGGSLKQAVVHRDIKSSNVMLDADWNGRPGDFGLARVVQKNISAQSASNIVGTRGYLAPEYARAGKVSVKTNVYSFGVLVLEVVTGRRPLDWRQPHHKQVLVDWIRSLHQENERLEGAADPALGGAVKVEQVLLLVRLGLLCTADDPEDRPSMRQIVQSLPSNTEPLLFPSTNAPFYNPSLGRRRSLKLGRHGGESHELKFPASPPTTTSTSSLY